MQVQNQLEVVKLSHFFDPLLYQVDWLVQLRVWKVPNSVEVRPRHSSSVIPSHHALDVHHWHKENGVEHLQMAALFVVKF